MSNANRGTPHGTGPGGMHGSHATAPDSARLERTSEKRERRRCTMKRRLVVVGGVAAGMSAASRAKRVDPDLDVIVLEKGEYISYGACSLPYFLAGHFHDYRKLIARTPEEAREHGIDVRTGHEAVHLDVGQNTVTVRRRDGGEEKLAYDALVLATGTVPIVPRDWGVGELGGVFLLRTIDDARALRAELEANKPRRAVVVGGGYIGVEAADALLEQGLSVTVVDVAPQLLTNFDADVAKHVEEDLRSSGADVRLGDGVAGLEAAEGRVVGVRTASGELLPADVVLVALGVRPNVALAEAAGIALGETGAIAVDAEQRTSVDNAFAAGDCCEALHLVTGKPAYVPLGTTANKQGRVAGTVIGGGRASFPGIVGTAVLKARDVAAARTGLTEGQARELGFDAASATIKSMDRVATYPGAREIRVKLVAERGTGRLLGGQVVGYDLSGVSGRIDVIAAALTTRMDAEAFSQLDLSYAPPFAQVWDPLLVAANVLQRKL